MPSTFIFGCPKLEMRFYEIPFPKCTAYTEVVLDILRRRYNRFFPSINA